MSDLFSSKKTGSGTAIIIVGFLLLIFWFLSR